MLPGTGRGAAVSLGRDGRGVVSGGTLRLRAGLALDAERVHGACEVVVEGGRIVAVEPAAGIEASAGRVLGGDACLLMPGLVNAHTHLSMTLLRGVGADRPLDAWLSDHIWPAEARMGREDVYWGALLGAAEALLSGTTAVADMYFHEDAVAEACVESGLRASLAIGLAGEGAEFAARLARAAGQIADWRGRGVERVEMRLGPHAPYTCPPASLRRVARAAAEVGCGVHIHLAETRSEVEAALSAHGRTPVELAADAGLFERPTQAAHVVWPRPGDSALLAAGDVVVAHCPASNLQLASGIAPALALADAGVRLALGADGPASAPSLDMFETMRLGWLIGKGAGLDAGRPTAREAFAWATLGGAAALGLEDVGRIAVGQRADLVLVDRERPGLWPPPPDPYAAVVQGVRAADVRAVVVDGEVRVEDGRLVGLDAAALRREALARAARLRGPASGG